MNFIETCRKFIEIDSAPLSGNAEIVQFAAELCRAAGLEVEIQNENLNGLEQANLIARPPGRIATDASLLPEEFLLQTHLDTSDPGSYGLWTKTGANPYNASIYQDNIFGLGAADTKLDFLCKLEAIRLFLKNRGDRPWKLPFVLVGTFGEEQGMVGAVRLIRKKKINATMAMVGEPTELAIVQSGKGFAGVEIEIPFSTEEKEFRAQHDSGDGTTTQSRVFIGKAAHSSVPQMGESAILKMFDYMAKLPEGIAVMELEGGTNFNSVPAHAVLEIDMVGGLKESIGSKISKIFKAILDVEKRFKAYPDPEFDPPEPTMNIGTVRSFEDFVKIGGCVRLPPSVSDEVYEEWMDVLRRACGEVGAVFRVTEYKQPFRKQNADELIRICSEELVKLGRLPTVKSQAVANEANVFSRFGIACVVIGPGRGVGNSHAPNENVSLAELEAATQFYKNVLERVCL